MKKSTLVFILLSGFASLCNYITYPLLARTLNDEQFVSITVALAIFTQISSFTLSIVALTIGISKQKNAQNAASIIEKLQAILIHLFIVLLSIFVLCSPIFFKQLSLPLSLLAPIALMLSLSIIMSVISGYLNGKGKLIKLGTSLAVTAIFQLLLSVGASIATRSGTATLYAMSLGTILSLVFIYTAYRQEGLPRLLSVFNHKFDIYKSRKLRALLTYIIAASLAILAINILLILDLLVINSRQHDSKVYADIYVLSRVVYFGGMLFVWPFLANINIYDPRKNIRLFANLGGVFTAITAGATFVMAFFGQHVTQILFGSKYQSNPDITELALLAILYKFSFLIITGLVLYFIVIRSYWAVWMAVLATVSLGCFVLLTNDSTSSKALVQGLNIVSCATVLLGAYGLFRTIKSGTPKAPLEDL